MHNHKLEIIWHFSCLKMIFFYKNESGSDSLHRTQLGLGVRAAFLFQPPIFYPFFKAVFYTNTDFFFIPEENAAESKLKILLFQLLESRESISDSQLYPFKALEERPEGGRLRHSSLELPSSCYNHFAR